MARCSLIAQIFRWLLLSGTAGSLGLAALSPATAEPTGMPVKQPELAASLSSAAGEQGVEAVFATRWAEPVQEFSVGADGEIRRSVHSDANAQIDSRQGSRINSRRLSKDSQNRSFLESVDPYAGECGASPADPDAIQRLIVGASHRHQVDPTFALAIAFAESRFDRMRNSPKGARGPMQLIPATAVRFGVDDICNPISNIEGGVAYLRQLFDEFRNPLLVAAAYNAGENRIREHGGIPPIRETLGFVAAVINYQLGITAPAGSKATSERISAKPFNTAMPSTASVISSTTHRQWVDGVMQF